MNRLIKSLLILLCLIPVVWFIGRPGVLIDGSDTNFPLDPIGWFSRRLYVWNASNNAGSDFSASTAGTIFHFVQVIPTLLGFSLQATEILSLVFWFSAILIAAFFLARTILPKYPILQVLFASIYAINPYMFNTWENAKVSNISLVLALPIFINIIISLNQNKLSLAKGLLFSTIFGLLISGTGINPAYFLVFAITFWICAAVYWKSFLKSLLVFVVILLVNAFWILPTANFVFGNIGPFGGLEKIGYTNWIDSLSQNTSLYNVLRLQGAWDWYSFESSGQPTYIPYAVNYFYKVPFIMFSLIFPFVSMLAFIFHEKHQKTTILFSGTLLILGLFMAAGTHAPTGILFKWLLVKRLPFFSLFRSPWYIFTPLIILAYANLVGIFFEKLVSKSSKVIHIIVAVIFVGNLVYCYPLITGKIFRPTMSDNFYIKFPNYVFEAQKWLKSVESGLSGRILSYPPDEIERFKWGYNGIDSILSLLSSVEVLFSPLNAPEFTTANILRELYHDLGNGDIEAAGNLASKLNISMIFEKKDQGSLAPQLTSLIRGNEINNFGQWSFYPFLETKTKDLKISAPRDIFLAYPIAQAERGMGLLTPEQVLLNPKDTVVRDLKGVLTESGKLILTENSQLQTLAKYEKTEFTLASRIFHKDLSKVSFIFTIDDEEMYEPILETAKLNLFSLTYSANLDGQNIVLEVENTTPSYIHFKPIYLKPGEHKLTFQITPPNLTPHGNFESGVNFTNRNNLVYQILEDRGNHYLEMVNKDRVEPAPAATFDVKNFDPSLIYLIKVRYLNVYGEATQVEVNQSKGVIDYRHQVESLPRSSEWQTYSFFIRPVFTESTLKINLVSPSISNIFGTKILFDDLEVYPLLSNNMFFVKKPKDDVLSVPLIKFKKISPVLYEGEVSQASGPHMITFLENYSPQWQWQSNAVKDPPHFTANLYANAWYIESAPETYKFKLYYKPQTWRYWGIGITLGVISAALFYFIYDKRFKKDR